MGYKFCNAKIKDIWYIFMGLSETTFSSVEIAIGTKGTLQLSCEAMISAMKTLETIDYCCSRRVYADAFTLIRKFRDDIMQYLFLLTTIKRKTGITDKECEEFVFNEENMIKMIEYDFQLRKSGERKEEVIVNIVVVFLCCLAIIDSTKLRSSDYIDALEVGLKPQEGSQYWVMYSIVNFFANYVDEKIIDYIQEQDSYEMKLKSSFYDD